MNTERTLMPKENPLQGQVALVTGGSSGIGLDVSHALAEAGAAVAVKYVGSAIAAGRWLMD